MAQQFFSGNFLQSLPGICSDDLTPPTFAGIDAVIPQSGGELLLSWLAATDLESGIHGYNIYIGLGSLAAGALFVPSNRAMMILHPDLQARVYRLKNLARLIEGQLYSVGVRAVDNSGNEDGNTAILEASSFGVLDDTAANLAQAARLALLIGSSADLEGDVYDNLDLEGFVDDDEIQGDLEDC